MADAVAPLRKVKRSLLMWEGNPHAARRNGYHFRRDELECGHTVEIGFGRSLKARGTRRCDECRISKPEALR